MVYRFEIFKDDNVMVHSSTIPLSVTPTYIAICYSYSIVIVKRFYLWVEKLDVGTMHIFVNPITNNISLRDQLTVASIHL